MSRQDYNLTHPAQQRGKKNPSPPPTRKQAQVTPNTRPTKSTGPTLATKDRNQKEEGIWPWRLGKGDLKHSQLKKMKRQRNIVQMKEQARNTQDRINKEEIGKLPEKEFRVLIVNMIQNLENRMEKMQESINIFNKDLEEIKE